MRCGWTAVLYSVALFTGCGSDGLHVGGFASGNDGATESGFSFPADVRLDSFDLDDGRRDDSRFSGLCSIRSERVVAAVIGPGDGAVGLHSVAIDARVGSVPLLSVVWNGDLHFAAHDGGACRAEVTYAHGDVAGFAIDCATLVSETNFGMRVALTAELDFDGCSHRDYSGGPL